MKKGKKEYKINPERKAIKEKVEQIAKVTEDVSKYPALALIDLRSVPDALLQTLRKRIREQNGVMYVLKKPVIKAILNGNPLLTKFSSLADRSVSLLLTNSSPYEINKLLRESKKKRPAKAGEISPFDIVIPEGETDLPPGPALSELKSAGLNVQIKGGKIVIAKESTVVKKGENITAAKAGVLQKLGVLPFDSSVRLLFGFDGEYVYDSEILDLDLTINEDIALSMQDAFSFSINVSYPTEQNINLLLGETYRQSVNTAINGGLYSSSTIEQLLSSTFRQGMALESVGKKNNGIKDS